MPLIQNRLKRFFILIVGILGILAGANLLAIQWVQSCTQAVIERRWHALLQVKQPSEWLILGDSTGNVGIIPEVFEQELGTTAVNFATVQEGFILNSAWMLDYYVHHVGIPRYVLMVNVHTTWMLNEKTWNKIHLLSQIPLAEEVRNQLQPSVPVNGIERLQIEVDRLFPLYSKNISLPNLIRDPWKSYQKCCGINPEGIVRIATSYPDRVVKALPGTLSYAREARFMISDLNLQALKAMQVLAEQYQFDIYFVSSPLYEELFHHPDFQSYFRDFEKALTDWTAAHPRMHYLSSREINLAFPKNQMENLEHVIEEGARIYTQRVARAMPKHLSSV